MAFYFEKLARKSRNANKYFYIEINCIVNLKKEVLVNRGTNLFPCRDIREC